AYRRAGPRRRGEPARRHERRGRPQLQEAAEARRGLAIAGDPYRPARGGLEAEELAGGEPEAVGVRLAETIEVAEGRGIEIDPSTRGFEIGEPLLFRAQDLGQ